MMRNTVFFLILPLLCAASDRPPQLEALADLARGAPPEFGADALIRIAGADSAPKAWRIELLEEAFRLGGASPYPFRLRPAVFRFDGQSGYLERAYSQELDALSLQTRAIEAMLPLDGTRARRLFLELAPPRLPRLECKDGLVPDVSRFYVTLGRVAAETFSPKEVKEEEPYKLLLRYSSLTSPAQIGPLAQMLAASRLTDPQFLTLVNGLAAGLKHLQADDRAFSQAKTCGLQIKALSQALEKRGQKRTGLIEAYRSYIVRHLTAARCGDTARFEVKVAIEAVPSVYSDAQAAGNIGPFFNDTLRIDPIPPLSVEEQTPAKQAGEAEGLKGCDSPECAAVGKQYKALLMKSEGVPYTPVERATAEWKNLLKSVLSAMADWKEDAGFSAAEHFRFKVTMYSDMLAVVPPGSDRDSVLRAAHEFLRQSRLDAPNRIEWFLPASALIGRVGLDPLGLSKLGEELAGSGDLVISLYARLEKVVPRTPDRIVSLF